MPQRRKSGPCMYPGIRVLSKSHMQATMFWVKSCVGISTPIPINPRPPLCQTLLAGVAPRFPGLCRDRAKLATGAGRRITGPLRMEQLPDIVPFRRRFEELAAQMASPAFYANPRRAADVTREHQKLQKLTQDYDRCAKLEAEESDARELARDAVADPGMRELAQAELPELARRLESLRQAVLLEMIPPDPTDSRNTVMEIRAGTGGEEAALFAAERSEEHTSE